MVSSERDWIISIFGKTIEYGEHLINEFMKVSKSLPPWVLGALEIDLTHSVQYRTIESSGMYSIVFIGGLS